MAPARYYVAEHNPHGAAFPGVPLRDLEQEEYDALPAYQQAEVDASPMYRKTNPDAPRVARKNNTPSDETQE